MRAFFLRNRLLTCAFLVVVVLMTARLSPIVDAALYSASGLLGQPDASGNPDYTIDGANNSRVDARVMDSPYGTALDTVNNRLFVVDSSNNRVLVFQLDSDGSVTSTSATHVLGQPGFTTNDATTTRSGLNTPLGAPAFDPTNQRLFVTDYANHRVVVYDVAPGTIANGSDALYVLGQSNFTASSSAATQSGLNNPTDITYDATSTRLFISDYRNRRVLVFDVAPGTIANGMNASYVLGQPDFTTTTSGRTQSVISNNSGVAFDHTTGRLFVADYFNNRIMVFDAATSTITNGSDAVNVLGQTLYTSGTYGTVAQSNVAPIGLGIDVEGQRLFAGDYQGNRVLVFDIATSTIENGANAINVLGQSVYNVSTASTTRTGLSTPGGGISFHPTTGKLYVADSGNNRVMVFDAATSTIANGSAALTELGQYDDDGNVTYTTALANISNIEQGFDSPYYTDLDFTNHRLFVSDLNNNRVLVYQLDSSNNIISQTPSYVLGQSSLTTKVAATSQSGMRQPADIVYDHNNDRLFVADSGNNRILVFDAAPGTIANGMNASNVLGQTNFTNNSFALTQSGMRAPWALAYDHDTDRLFEEDYSYNRVLVFNVAPGTISDGIDASAVLGQADFTSNVDAVTQSGMKSGNEGVIYDTENKRLFVADKVNARVLVFDASTATLAATPAGLDASYVIGQPDFTTANSVTTQSGFQFSTDVAYDPVTKTLFVSDYHNYRVMLFDVAPGTIANGMDAYNVIGQSDYTSMDFRTTQTSVGTAYGLTYDHVNRHLFVVDQLQNRVLQLRFVDLASTTLASGTTGSSYSATLSSTNSQGTLSYTVYSGSLPTGLSLNASTGAITGTPTAAGTYTFTIQANDTSATGAFIDREEFTVTIAQGASSSSSSSNSGAGSYSSGYTPSVSPVSSSVSTTSAAVSAAATTTVSVVASSTAPKPSPTFVPLGTSETTLLVPIYGPYTMPTQALSTPMFTRLLWKGEVGEEVTLLQQVLRRLGFFTYPENTGIYGDYTRDAVAAFQFANNLKPVGSVGPYTLELINTFAPQGR